MGAQHTPGPWQIRGAKFSDGLAVWSGTPGGPDEYRVCGLGVAGHPDECSANAALIAAAPAMLALLQRFKRFSETTGFVYPLGSLQELEEIVAKATGAAP